MDAGQRKHSVPTPPHSAEMIGLRAQHQTRHPERAAPMQWKKDPCSFGAFRLDEVTTHTHTHTQIAHGTSRQTRTHKHACAHMHIRTQKHTHLEQIMGNEAHADKLSFWGFWGFMPSEALAIPFRGR